MASGASFLFLYVNMLQRHRPHGTGKKCGGPAGDSRRPEIKIWYAPAAHNPCTSYAQLHRHRLKAGVGGHTSSSMTAMVR
jgi:hypothetical protein